MRKSREEREQITSHKSKLSISAYKYINGILWTGLLISIAVVISKAFGKDTIGFADVTFSVRESWIIFFILTLAHWYTAAIAIAASHLLFTNATLSKRRQVYSEVTTNGGKFTLGMLPRTPILDEEGKARVWKMDYTDPTTILAYTALALLFVAVFPFKSLFPFETFEENYNWYVIAAFLIAMLNWRIGANWSIALTELNLPSKQVVYNKGTGPFWFQPLSQTSGGPLEIGRILGVAFKMFLLTIILILVIVLFFFNPENRKTYIDFIIFTGMVLAFFQFDTATGRALIARTQKLLIGGLFFCLIFFL